MFNYFSRKKSNKIFNKMINKDLKSRFYRYYNRELRRPRMRPDENSKLYDVTYHKDGYTIHLRE